MACSPEPFSSLNLFLSCRKIFFFDFPYHQYFPRAGFEATTEIIKEYYNIFQDFQEEPNQQYGCSSTCGNLITNSPPSQSLSISLSLSLKLYIFFLSYFLKINCLSCFIIVKRQCDLCVLYQVPITEFTEFISLSFSLQSYSWDTVVKRVASLSACLILPPPPHIKATNANIFVQIWA